MIFNKSQRKPYLKLAYLAFPLILANITVPLLGLVDTAILGHMQHTHYLAGAAIASLIYTQIIWICGFLKMSVTGLSAQAKSASSTAQYKLICQACFLALLLGVFLCVFQRPILSAGIWFASTTPEVQASASEYFLVRVWSAPASLINLVLLGWLIGQQKTKQVLYLQVLVNLANIVFSLLFVYVLDWGIKGVALGTVLADYILLAICAHYTFVPFVKLAVNKAWFSLLYMRPLLNLNGDILIRNIALQFTLAFITFKGAEYGETTAATNAIIMQFFALTALGLDGVANAVEALVGEAKGKGDISELSRQVNIGLVWSSIFALVYMALFALFGPTIIDLLTDQSVLRQSAKAYLSFAIWMPLIAHWCFLFDGVYVGLSLGKTMRNSMVLSTCFGFIPAFWVFISYQNEGLWYALFVFLAARGLLLGAHYIYSLKCQPRTLIASLH